MAYSQSKAESQDRDRHTPNKNFAHMVTRWVSRKSTSSSQLSYSERESASRASSPTSTQKTSIDNNAFPLANTAIQAYHQTSRPPQLPRSSISSDVSSIASRSTAAPSTSPYDLHPVFRKHVFPHLPLSSMYEDAELVWTSTEAKSSMPRALLNGSPPSRSTPSPSSVKTPVRDTAKLPVFAISPTDKIFIEPVDMQAHTGSLDPAMDLVRTILLPGKDKGDSHSTTVFSIDISPASYIIASKQGDRTIRIHGLPQSNLQATLKPSFYIQMQERSRDFFVTSHAILSETRSLIAVAVGFGHTLEIWDWARKKKLQVMESAYRWAAPKIDIYETNFSALACYREVDDSIALYPVTHPSLHGAPTPKNPPFGAPTIIDLTRAGLPHTPKFPELAYSTTAPLLVAAAGPRPPRPGHPPPQHAAMLMAWTLPIITTSSCRPWRSTIMPAHHPQLATALPCGLATHGGVAVSIWIPHHVRVIGRAGAWQVEPVVAVPERFVVVWALEQGTTAVFAIPNVDTLACVSPDCRFVAYRQGPGAEMVEAVEETGCDGLGRGREVCLVVVDALRGGREVWRTPGKGGGGCRLERDCGQLMDLSRVTALAFSGDGGRLLVGDAGGSVGVYEIRMRGQGDVNLVMV